MKLLYVKAKHFKNVKDDFEIDFVAKSKKPLKIKNMNFRRLLRIYLYTTHLLLLERMHLVRQLLSSSLIVATLS